ncbi:hypothetical protein FKM82_026511 [Ascaphus truei]
MSAPQSFRSLGARGYGELARSLFCVGAVTHSPSALYPASVPRDKPCCKDPFPPPGGAGRLYCPYCPWEAKFLCIDLGYI